jgi:hypothetical protein
MMRTRGLTGPFFGRHVGNRSSHPLAHSVGNIAGLLGPEMLLNGSFSGNADDWSLGVGWSYGDNNAAALDASGTLLQTIPILSDRTYRVAYKVTGHVVGQFRSRLIGLTQTANGTTHESDGMFVDIITMSVAGGGVQQFRVAPIGVGPLTIDVDNCSVREVL